MRRNTRAYFAVLAVHLLFFIEILVARCLQGGVNYDMVQDFSAGLGLCWSHMPTCWKSHAAAQLCFVLYSDIGIYM